MRWREREELSSRIVPIALRRRSATVTDTNRVLGLRGDRGPIELSKATPSRKPARKGWKAVGVCVSVGHLTASEAKGPGERRAGKWRFHGTLTRCPVAHGRGPLTQSGREGKELIRFASRSSARPLCVCGRSWGILSGGSRRGWLAVCGFVSFPSAKCSWPTELDRERVALAPRGGAV